MSGLADRVGFDVPVENMHMAKKPDQSGTNDIF